MKRIKKSLKKRSGRALLSLLLAASLAMGGMTTALATEEEPTKDETVTEEAVDAMPDEDSVTVSADEPVGTAANIVAEDADDAANDTLGAGDEQKSGVDDASQTDIVTYDHTVATANTTDNDTDTSIDGPDEAVFASDTDYDPSYGLYGGYDGKDSMDDPDTAGACVGWDILTRSAITSDSGLWWIDDYYVGESSLYDTEKTDDFSLKYQVEFHASEDFAAEAVQIVIDASLGTYRNGNNIIPTDIGIPYGTPGDYTTSSSSPFNYYYFYYDAYGNEVILTASQAAACSGEVYIKVWNYRDIASGSNAMFQVLYQNMDIMQIADQSEWNLAVSAEVDIQVTDDEGYVTGTITETVDGNTLHGDVDTYATLSSVTKKAYTLTSASYTPELYTQNQVNSYISGTLGEPYASNFDDYIYIVWQVSLNGTATQAYEITVDENTFGDITGDGNIVGYKVYTTSNGVSSRYDTDADGNPTLSFNSSTQRKFSATFYVVTAYDADTYVTDTELENDVTVTVHPADGYDDDTIKSASATTTWGEYEWNYSGDTIGISKEKNDTYSAYLTLYELNAAKEKDTGSFPFTVNSTDRGYGLTHYTEGENVGQWIEGSYYTTTTVDDALYAYPNGGTTPSRMLTKDDYYFSSVTVTTTDAGYDVWEDKTASPAEYDGVDQSVYIYAMFYDADEDAMDADGWEYVATVPFSTSGTMTYTFTSDDLARQPYRIKAVHSTANYSTACRISLSVMLRYDSPMLQWCADYCKGNGIDYDSLKIENLCGVAGQTYGVPGYADGTYLQSQNTGSSNYSEKDTETGETLAEFTEDLYGTILQRDNAYKTLTRLTETAAASKSVSTENDAANSRVLANYTITAYEAYNVTGSSTADALKEAGISLPERHEVAYYDLLPYGMQFNANATVTAGRITTMSGSWQTNARAWDTTNVTVTVEDADIITNWNGTGRTMVIFHIYYDGEDASAYYNNLWFEGFGISFQAYYDWTDLDVVDAEYNIAAYIVEGEDGEAPEELLGKEGSQVYKDDGSASLASQYAPFMGVSDLNGDGYTDLYTNMYASTSTNTNVATASSDSIKKLVRADDDAVAEYGTTAVVGNGKGYTYEISLTNNYGATLSNVVLYDRLEYSVEDDRVDVENESNPNSVFHGLPDSEIYDNWKGTFTGISLTALTDAGIAPVVYYSADRDAPISENGDENGDGKTTPSDVLTEANGWYTEERFIEVYGDFSEVKAVAVDISKTTTGGDFILDVGESLSLQIHMTAPDGSDYLYAFNNPSYYSVSTSSAGDVTSSTDIGDTVRVELGEAGILEVEKEFADGAEIPASMQNARFTFAITRKGSVLTNQEYMIYVWDKDANDWISTGVISATDMNGQFTLRAGQKAVFSQLVDVEDVEITEIESVLWDSKETEADPDEIEHTRYILFENSYRSPVYLYKTAETTDLATDEELADAAFTFRLEVDTDGDGEYEPYVGEYMYVKEVLTNGSSPAIDTTKGEDGYGYTDNGEVTLKLGDIIVFFPCDEDGNYLNVPYRIVETETGDEWVCFDDTVSGTTTDTGKSNTITNYYKYRSLIITKDLSDYDHDLADCEDEWTFKLTNANGDPVTGNHWYMIDANGNPVYMDVDGKQVAVEGCLDDNGEFSFPGAGSSRRVVVEGLVEGEQYTLTETGYDEELYAQVNDGTADVTMPVYSISRSITITNKYLMKDLSVEKLVLTSEISGEIRTHEFTFTLEKYDSETGEYVPVGGASYTVDGEARVTNDDGTFTLTHGQKAYFDDIGYMDDEYRITETPDDEFIQIYPAGGDPCEVELGSDSMGVQFINGDFDEVVSLSKSLNGLDVVGEAYADLVKNDNTAETLKSGVYTVDVTFGVYDGNDCVTSAAGNLIDYNEDNADYPYVYIKVCANGDYTVYSYNGGEMTESLAPYDYIYIAEVGNYTVKASESADMERALLDVNNDTRAPIGSEAILSEGNVMSGSAVANENIVLVNDISSAHKESEIYKLMTEDSDAVPADSEIVFLVEIFNGETWSPASGIKYIAFDGYMGDYDTTGCVVTSGVRETGADGRITLTAGNNGYPYIRFIEDTVYANIPDEEAIAGDIRIVESSMDDAWGHLVGYDSEEWDGGPALSITYADTFVNGNDDGLAFEVEKEMVDDKDVDAEFLFHVMQVISASASPITAMDEITESVPGAELYYIVYDAATGEMISDGYTDANGTVAIKAGQYARIYAPKNTTWYVYEGTNPGYPLYSTEANDDPAGDGPWGYAENASVVDDVNGVVQETTEAELKPVTAFAIYSADDNSLTFYTARKVPAEGDLYNGRNVTNIYTGIGKTNYSSNSSVPWYSNRTTVTDVVIDASFAEADVTNLQYWFYGYTNAVFTGLENIDTSKVTTLYYTFDNCKKLDNLDSLSKWDTGAVKTLWGTFYGCSALTNVDGLSGWDTGAVTTLWGTFYGCSALTNVDGLSGWDTGAVTTLQSTFSGCSALTNVDGLSGWDTGAVTALQSTFYNCSGLTNVDDLSGWDTGTVTTLFRTFYGCSGLTNVDGLSGWDTGAVTTLYGAFYGCSGLTNVDGLSGWDTGAVKTLYETFRGCSGLTNVDGLSGWDTGAVTTLQFTFRGCSGLTNVDGLSGWDTGAVTTLYYTFYSCSGLTNVDGLSGWDTGAVTTLQNTFYGCSGLINVDGLSGWDTGVVTTLYEMFRNCFGLTNVDGLSGWNTGAVTTLDGTFRGCSGLTNVDGLSGWNTGAVTTMQYTFYNCFGITNVDGLSSWDTGAVKRLYETFYGCSGLTNMDGLSGWDTGAVTTLYYTFGNCWKLSEIDMSKWDTANVTDMRYMFYNCSGLTTIYSDDDVFVTSAVTSGEGMFRDCSKLVGGNGTKYDSSNYSYSMAHVDTENNPGYFTDIADKP